MIAPIECPPASNDGIPASMIPIIERRFGTISLDLAADERNHKAPRWIDLKRDTFTVDWATELANGRGWLNPPAPARPFHDHWNQLDRWASKCILEASRGARIISMWPFITSANWFWAILRSSALHVIHGPISLLYESEPDLLTMIATFNCEGQKGTLRAWELTMADFLDTDISTMSQLRR